MKRLLFELGQEIDERRILGIDNSKGNRYPYLVSDLGGPTLKYWKMCLEPEDYLFMREEYDHCKCSWYTEKEVKQMYLDNLKFHLGDIVLYKGQPHKIIGVDVATTAYPYFIEVDSSYSNTPLNYWVDESIDRLAYLEERLDSCGIWVEGDELVLLDEARPKEEPISVKKPTIVEDKTSILKYKICIALEDGKEFSGIIEGLEKLEEIIKELDEALESRRALFFENVIVPVGKVSHIYWEKVEE